MQVAAHVIGNDAAVTWGGASGNFELNVMMPMIAHNLLESISLLAAAADSLGSKCIVGIEANVEQATMLVERNISIVTALNPHIGYDKAAEIAQEAFATGRGVREVALEKGVLAKEQLDEILDPRRMTEGGILD